MLSSCFVNNSSTIGTQGDEEADPRANRTGVEASSEQLKVGVLTDGLKYTLKGVRQGGLVFIDRPYYFSDTAPYEGYCTLQTAMDDKMEEGDSFLRFSISRPTTVYVGYDTRSPLPAWLSGWSDTGDELVMADDNARYWPYLSLRLFKKTFPKGTVDLGGNAGAGSMYAVLLDNGNDGCALTNDRMLELSWYSNQDEIDGYTIYLEEDAEWIPLLSVDVDEIADPQNPAITFRSWSDLGVMGEGDSACFSVSAFRDNVESELSSSRCINM